MAQPAVRVLKILLDWPEKASVLVVASLAVSACCEGFSILRVFQKLGILAYHTSRRVGRKSASGPCPPIRCLPVQGCRSRLG